ncbi:C4-dicarboxylate transporter DcuC [Photobacterium sp. DNB23_23_1]|uniref:C4-dicarboxylate transporter DcuC n=1 Tax=Photobacterium pectinilyticum TaxID=2906793 RepID=A0ABT1N4M2_9GAMM|nr:C4-dicarboxylate transporter DcuC [Photobacterium sp. ZSDE20]MCQ1059683.1 C4-dicarboxylate transporter DcuC [Photobacterium sp. ZSDE20]MDD1825850.1 C4-dicarboxylate transporter DcuC [Photobacterium sp. ZSDE20]
MLIQEIIGLLVIAVTVYALIKQYEPRTVLLIGGLVLACVSLDPMSAFDSFASRMTTGSLIMAICSGIGFAGVVSATRCDEHLVGLLSKPLSKMGVFLVPAVTVVTMAVNVAIPSAAGCTASVGAVLIPFAIRAGVAPAMAAASVVIGTFASFGNPDLSHNVFISELAGLDNPVDVVLQNANRLFMLCGLTVVGITLTAFWRKDISKVVDNRALQFEEGFRPRVLPAMAPFLPLVILFGGRTVWPAIETQVPQAMLIGTVVCILVTGNLRKTEKVVTSFFDGAGQSYGTVMGLIISATVFSTGLRSVGLVDSLIDILTQYTELARWGGSLGPFLLGVISGSGDAAAFAFNEAVTPSSEQFGMTIIDLGTLSSLSGALGRTMSPIAGAVILAAGLAKCSPIEIVRRTAPIMVVSVMVTAVVFV